VLVTLTTFLKALRNCMLITVALNRVYTTARYYRVLSLYWCVVSLPGWIGAWQAGLNQPGC